MQVTVNDDLTLLVDGDGLAYYASGRKGATPASARRACDFIVRQAARVSGAGRVKVLLTASGSSKGGRYQIARVKPYQGRRSAHKPDLWAFVREHIKASFQHVETATLEADDMFATHSHLEGGNVAILSEDKDMRMIPGYHVNWQTLEVVHLRPGVFSLPVGDKLFGEHWFWMQMLHGDTVDNIPGLPGSPLIVPGKTLQVGPARAWCILQGATCREDARALVSKHYRAYYGDRWAVEMLEQGVLLWLRRTPYWWDVVDVLFDDQHSAETASALAEIQLRLDSPMRL